MTQVINRSISKDIRDGDEKAFEVFFRAEFNNLCHFIESYTNDFLLSGDIAQETFISLWDKRDLIDETLNIRSYLYSIAKNKALNIIRQKYFRQTDSIEKQHLEIIINSLESKSVESKLDSLELKELIERTYKNLPLKVRDSFVLNRKQGLSYSQIAKIKGIPVKAVEYQIKIALVFFKRRLKNYMLFFL